jgi:hypothetical protein
MLEQFFEYEENRKVFEDYDFRQAWASDMLLDFKFIWVVAEDVSLFSYFSVSLTTLLSRASGAV